MSRNYTEMRQLIESAKGRFCSVTFIKKDSTVRVMNIQPAAIKGHLIGDKASESAKRAVETRKQNHPNLLNVWDNGKQGIRSVNLDTVTEIKLDGEVYKYGT